MQECIQGVSGFEIVKEILDSNARTDEYRRPAKDVGIAMHHGQLDVPT